MDRIPIFPGATEGIISTTRRRVFAFCSRRQTARRFHRHLPAKCRTGGHWPASKHELHTGGEGEPQQPELPSVFQWVKKWKSFVCVYCSEESAPAPRATRRLPRVTTYSLLRVSSYSCRLLSRFLRQAKRKLPTCFEMISRRMCCVWATEECPNQLYQSVDRVYWFDPVITIHIFLSVSVCISIALSVASGSGVCFPSSSLASCTALLNLIVGGANALHDEAL